MTAQHSPESNSARGIAICPYCEQRDLIWPSDQDYADVYDDEAAEGLVIYYTCANCSADAQVAVKLN